MEQQNINLITTLNVQPASILDAKLILRAVIGWTLLLVLVYFVSLNSKAQKQNNLDELKPAESAMQKEIDALNKELETLKNVALPGDPDSLPSGSSHLGGFYNQLKALAFITPDEVWLDKIILLQPSNPKIRLRGKATTAEGVSLFLEALNNSKQFNKNKIAALHFEKTKNSNNVNFTVGTGTLTDTKTKKPITITL